MKMVAWMKMVRWPESLKMSVYSTSKYFSAYLSAENQGEGKLAAI